MVDLMDFFIKFIASLIWAAIGLVLWIPLIARSAITAVGVYVLFAVQGKPPPDFSAVTAASMRFYPDGFAAIWNTIEAHEDKNPHSKFDFVKVLTIILTSIIFWMPVFLFIGLPSKSSSEVDSNYNKSTFRLLRSDKIIIDQKPDCWMKWCKYNNFGTLEFRRLTIENGIFSDSYSLESELCASDTYDIPSGYGFSLYYVDLNGKAINFDHQAFGEINPGSCKILFSKVSKGSTNDIESVNFTQGNFYLNIVGSKYKISIYP